MSRGIFVYRDGEIVEKHLAPPIIMRGPHSEIAAPMLNLDTIDAFRSMADGRLYESKAAYRASLKAHGYREIGNEVAAHIKEATAPRAKPPAKPAIVEAYKMVRDGYKPAPPAPRNDPDLD